MRCCYSLIFLLAVFSFTTSKPNLREGEHLELDKQTNQYYIVSPHANSDDVVARMKIGAEHNAVQNHFREQESDIFNEEDRPMGKTDDKSSDEHNYIMKRDPEFFKEEFMADDLNDSF